jgi:hypothetical protein
MSTEVKALTKIQIPKRHLVKVTGVATGLNHGHIVTRRVKEVRPSERRVSIFFLAFLFIFFLFSLSSSLPLQHLPQFCIPCLFSFLLPIVSFVSFSFSLYSCFL